MKLDPNKNVFYIVLFAAVVSGLFTAAIMALHVVSSPVVEAKRRLTVEKAIVQLFSLGDINKMDMHQIHDVVRRRVAGLEESGGKPIALTDPKSGQKVRILIAYKNDLPENFQPDIKNKENVLGYAFPIRGVGFWAMIDGWLAVSPDGNKTVGIAFTQHQETPGLGGRITEEEFLRQFRDLNISPPKGGNYFFIERTKPDKTSPRCGRHVDAITGATGTSTAIEKFANRDLANFRRVAEAAGLFAPSGGEKQGGD